AFFERFLFLFNSFVLLNKPINLCFELFDMIQSHGILRHKISGLSLVLSSGLVKPMFRRSTALHLQKRRGDRHPEPCKAVSSPPLHRNPTPTPTAHCRGPRLMCRIFPPN